MQGNECETLLVANFVAIRGMLTNNNKRVNFKVHNKRIVNMLVSN